MQYQLRCRVNLKLLRSILIRSILIALAFCGSAEESRTYSSIKDNPRLEPLSGHYESLVSGILSATTPSKPNIPVNGFFSVDKAKRGRVIEGAIVLDIPAGFHVNANRPLNKYSIPTVVKIEAPRGLGVGSVMYPRAKVLRLKAVNNEQLAVYDGRAIMRINVTMSSDFPVGMTTLKAYIKFQSCNDDTCFPPESRELMMPIEVVRANDHVKRINREVFGGR